MEHLYRNYFFMEKIYNSYTKVIDGTTYFFVKQFLIFSELPGVPPVLEKYGMHTSFEKACSIAGVKDKSIQKQLLETLENHTPLAKVIGIDDANYAGSLAASQ